MTAIRSISSTAAFAAFVAVLATASVPVPASAASQQAKYCIMRGGGEGSSGRTGDCVYSDYQQCLQAAARGGNCVQNIDYRGDASVSQSDAAPRARRRGR